MKHHNLKNYLTLTLLSLVLINCNNEEERMYQHLISFPMILASDTFHDDVLVTLYLTEEDYLLNQNPFLTTEADRGLEVYYNREMEFYYKATKGNLNNQRYFLQDITNSYNNHFLSWNPDVEGRTFCFLSTTPTRLQLSVTDASLQPIEGATVQLYISEQDFLDDIPAQERTSEWSSVYNGSFYDPYFLSSTDAAGEALFDNLDPRQFWFKVTKGSLTNASGVIKTTNALPDNADVTTVLSVIIK
jgi:hypothetical protein